MSVKMTVMTRRSVWRSGREPVTNSSQVSVIPASGGGLDEVIVAWDLDESGVGDPLGDVAARGDGDERSPWRARPVSVR
jgi:hypothetical protein